MICVNNEQPEYLLLMAKSPGDLSRPVMRGDILFPDELAVQCLSKALALHVRVLTPSVCPNHSSKPLRRVTKSDFSL